LVVEDEQGVREFLVEALDQLGYSVIDAANAADALTVLSGGAQVDALLTDVVMPGMNGRQLAEQAARTRPDLKVLYMTGYTRNAIVHNGVLDAGMRLLTKPFTLTELSEELRRALDEGKPR
ncbi:MAG: response regulator, partial [Hyphomonadaceae bacterium]